MRRTVFLLVATVALVGVLAYTAPISGQDAGGAAPIYGTKIPAGYRDWRLISVAHEEGNLNDLRVQLGNDGRSSRPASLMGENVMPHRHCLRW